MSTDPKTLFMKGSIIVEMCLPGYGMQGLDHLYIFIYPSLQCLLVNQSLHLYKERVSVVLLKALALLGNMQLLLSKRMSEKSYLRNNLEFRDGLVRYPFNIPLSIYHTNLEMLIWIV